MHEVASGGSPLDSLSAEVSRIDTCTAASASITASQANFLPYSRIAGDIAARLRKAAGCLQCIRGSATFHEKPGTYPANNTKRLRLSTPDDQAMNRWQ
jgi:hypothetical protein